MDRPTFRFLSADPLANRVPSELMSIDRTGSLCPYSDSQNLRLSAKKTLMVQSSRATARSLPRAQGRVGRVERVERVEFQSSGYVLGD